MSGTHGCLVCSPRKCRRSWIYVAYDHTLGLVKIGKSVNVSARFIGYRKETKRNIRLVEAHQITCDYEIIYYEAMAQSFLPEGLRVRGDWFDIEPELAINAVRWVAEGGMA